MIIFQLCSLFLVILILFLSICRIYRYLRRRKALNGEYSRYICFFHPYCDGGGGGERVLWVLIQAILASKTHIHHQIVIYSGEVRLSTADILQNVERKFSIHISPEQANRLQLVKIYSRSLLEAQWYPVATMIGQSIGSMIVCMECLVRFIPDVYWDTTGAAFTFPLAYWITGCYIATYVHYPTISTDMMKKVVERRPTYNNQGIITSSASISFIKQAYYHQFKNCYSYAGKYASTVVVNSSWTEGHIRELWEFNPTTCKRQLHKIYPPCNTGHLQSLSIAAWSRERMILSLGQFRPEKDHLLQLRALYELHQLDQHRYGDVILLMIGSVRNRDDEQILANVKKEMAALSLTNSVRYIVNASYTEVEKALATASIGIHTMWNEHFGISVVEMMAAGLIVVAHDSGGPKTDIVTDMDGQATGYLASTSQQYADKLKQALDLRIDESTAMRERARESSKRFSDDIFRDGMLLIK